MSSVTNILVLTVLLLLAPAYAGATSGVTLYGASTSPDVEAPPQASTCTDEVDCYCDTVSDPLLIMCEDFENPNYYSTTNWVAGSGSGSTFKRGDTSDWNNLYGDASYQGGFWYEDGVPTIGTRCGSIYAHPPQSNQCGGSTEYCSAAQGALVNGGGADCWGPNVNVRAQMDIQRSGDFDDEVALTLTGGKGATEDVGAGNTHLAYRYTTTANVFDSGLGRKDFTNKTEIGITMAHAYASNVSSTTILGSPWKHEEWFGTGGSGGYEEHWNLGLTGAYGSGYFPYQPFMWATSIAACNAAMANIQVHVGAVGCSNGGSIRYTANGSYYPDDTTSNYYSGGSISGRDYVNSGVTAYSRATDLPYGTWTCHRAHITGMGTSNVEVKIWNGSKLVIHFSNLDSAAMKNKDYAHFFWNGYSNKSVGSGLSAKTYRYRDNVHIRAGAPVACSAIGY